LKGNKNGKIQTYKPEVAIDQERFSDQMGTILDSLQDLWCWKEGAPRQAHACQEKLEKNQAKGVKMAKLERTYIVPLRRTFVKSPLYKRSKRAMTALKTFISKNMKSTDVKIGKNLNQFVWKDGIRNPPHHVKITAIKEEDGAVKAELFGFKYEELTKEEMEKAAEKDKKGKKEEDKEAAKADKIVEKVKNKPELAEEVLKKPKKLAEEEKLEEVEEELEKEELDQHDELEEEKEIKETLDEIKKTGPAKKAAPKRKPAKSKEE
jgi:large subunit ribosomal protein L31e